MKVVFGDELSSLVSLLGAEREPNRKILVILPSHLGINNCQQAVLKQIKTIQDVVFRTFDDLALDVLKENTGYAYDQLDPEVEREAMARALKDTGQPASVSNDLRENPSFITYMTETLFELRRNAKSVTTDKCSLPDDLENAKSVEGLTDFEKRKLKERVELSRNLIDEQWRVLQDAFKDRRYTRELAIAQATQVLSDPSGGEALPAVDQVFVGHPYHVDEVLFRFIVSIAKIKPVTYWVATDQADDNITERLEKELEIATETFKRPALPKSLPTASPDLRREIQYVAREVHRRVTAGELKLSDILVVTRDSGEFEDVFYEVMGEFGIPAEVQTRQYFKLLAVSHFYVSLLKFASGTDREMADALVEILETGYPGISEYSTYWMRARIQRLGMSYGGLVADLRALKSDEKIGGRPASWWLDQFGKLDKVKDLLGKAESVEDFLKVLISSEPRMGIVEYTSRRLQMHDATSVPRGVRARELEGTLRLLKRIWSLREAQDQVKDLMGVTKVDIKRFRELFEDFLATENYGSSIRSREILRLVDAGNVDFLRPKLMYIVGLSEGVFPSKLRETAFLGDRACKLLTENGVAYLQNSDTTRGYEKWLFSNSLGACDGSVSFSYSYLDSEGRPKLYSPFLISDQLYKIGDLEEAMKKRILADEFARDEATAPRDALRLASDLMQKEFSKNEQWKVKFQDEELKSEFAKIASGSERIRRPPPAGDLGSTSSLKEQAKFEIDALNEFSACQFRYYSRYLLELDPWKFRPYHRIGKFYAKVLTNLIPNFPSTIPPMLRGAVVKELEQRVRSNDIPNERMIRRISAVLYGYLFSEVRRCQGAASSIQSRTMKYALPISLNLDGIEFSGTYDRVDFLDEDKCLVCELRETPFDVAASFRGVKLVEGAPLPDYRLPYLIEQLRRDGKEVVGVEYHSLRPSNNRLPRQAGFVLDSYAKRVAAPSSVVPVSQTEFDDISNRSMKSATEYAAKIRETSKFRVWPIRKELCDTCSFSGLCLGPGGIPE